MFGRIFKYQLLQTIRTKEIMFWSLVFPIILGTLFHMAFGGIQDNTEVFRAVPAAYVKENGGDDNFARLLKELEEGDSSLVRVYDVDGPEAEALLKQDKIEGIFRGGETLTLQVKEAGINQSILKMVLEEYERKQSAFKNIAAAHPENLQKALESLGQDMTILKEENQTNGNMDNLLNYFYALLAMSSLYGCFMGVDGAIHFKANLSDIGARRVVASTNRFLLLAADVCAKILLQFICSCVALLYLTVVLKVDFGDKIPQILIVMLTGCVIGVMTGMFFGSLGKAKEQVKISIVLAVTMFECFLSGLMVAGMYYVVETYIPFLNRINPAALIVDSYYCLNIYDTYARFTQNIVTLLVIAVILCIGSYLAVRRERYASL